MKTGKRWLRAAGRAEDRLIRRLPRGAEDGSSSFGKIGDVVQHPPFWAGVGGALALAGGARGRRASLRGGVFYAVTALLANAVLKPAVGRPRPPGAEEGRRGPITSSFPSGHAAADVAFALGVAQELPLLIVPLAFATSAGHWSLVRTRGHYPSDVVAGGAVGVFVALAGSRLWRPERTAGERVPARGRC